MKNPLEKKKPSLVNGESRYQDTQALYLALPLSESKLLNFLLADSPSIKRDIITYTSHTRMVLRLISVCHMFSGDKVQSYWEDKCSCPPCLGFQGLRVIVPNDPQSSGSLSWTSSCHVELAGCQGSRNELLCTVVDHGEEKKWDAAWVMHTHTHACTQTERKQNLKQKKKKKREEKQQENVPNPLKLLHLLKFGSAKISLTVAISTLPRWTFSQSLEIKGAQREN